ncbi:MAG: Folate-dependent protein for Fe/S cluster synthesis/repair in oxidative stress [Myxococcaceae bacterium]|nr:Folate-dependent protein for Fe/S cluster synthesis/repair in oxidative stress [Myxococcaceae bacterium]
MTTALNDQRRALREAAGCLWLDDRAVITVRGDDRLTWLNGVVTADLRPLAEGHGIYTAIVAVKGKLLGDAFVHRHGEALRVVVPAAQREALMVHFERFIVMEDVALEATPERVLTAQGPTAHAATEAWAGRSTADRLGLGGVDLLVGEGDEAPASEGVVWVSREAFDAEAVAAGRARWGADFGVDNYVQEAAITPRAVSFNKGCYLGQEVVCRLEMRGHVQKQLVSLTRQGKAPEPGADVFAEGKVVGKVTGVTPAEGEAPARLLAMVRYAVLEKRPALEIDGAPADWAT